MKIAVIGATGAVGRQMLFDLLEAGYEQKNITAYASQRSEGKSIKIKGLSFTVKAFNLSYFQGEKTFILMSAGGAFSKEISPSLASLGHTIIDNSSAWRSVDSIPLIVPEVNGHLLKNFQSGIIANPNCSTIQLMLALYPLEKAFGLEEVSVATYQSVSGAGQNGIQELKSQLENSEEKKIPKAFSQTISGNVLSAIGAIKPSLYCEEEEKMILESRKILGLPDLKVYPTTARVPVFFSHCEAVCVRLKIPATYDNVLECLKKQENLVVNETTDPSTLPTPIAWQSNPKVSLSRLRLGYNELSSKTVQFWCVADNIKKGAATNGVQILDLLLNQ